MGLMVGWFGMIYCSLSCMKMCITIGLVTIERMHMLYHIIAYIPTVLYEHQAEEGREMTLRLSRPRSSISLIATR